MEYKYHAIILGKNNVGETDRIYTVYTKEAGKLGLLATGVRKPNAKLAGNLESLTYCQIFVAQNRGKGKITGVINEDNFSGIKNGILVLEKVFKVFNIFGRLITQEEKDEKTFKLLLDYLGVMEKLSEETEENKVRLEIVTAGFIFHLLANLGYGFETKKCAICQGNLSSQKNFFSAKTGGTLCLLCAKKESQKININNEAIKLIRVILENKIENLVKIRAEKESVDGLKRVANEAVRWIL